ncbi:hypothetical protein NDU88_006763 [Pleurodeles waltl]|uniref:Uncharacterized protein n=1 Tax=Pleurodeles waltl TaxID=8319 RepID=A0AAV7SQU3_PLEWA|nr:hypothetical protein NDU88_006763 [Pleurodeles waltl]
MLWPQARPLRRCGRSQRKTPPQPVSTTRPRAGRPRQPQAAEHVRSPAASSSAIDQVPGRPSLSPHLGYTGGPGGHRDSGPFAGR